MAMPTPISVVLAADKSRFITGSPGSTTATSTGGSPSSRLLPLKPPVSPRPTWVRSFVHRVPRLARPPGHGGGFVRAPISRTRPATPGSAATRAVDRGSPGVRWDDRLELTRCASARALRRSQIRSVTCRCGLADRFLRAMRRHTSEVSAVTTSAGDGIARMSSATPCSDALSQMRQLKRSLCRSHARDRPCTVDLDC